jgi:hypothetical protein
MSYCWGQSLVGHQLTSLSDSLALASHDGTTDS